MNENGLLPCPFCGGTAELRESADSFGEITYHVRCLDCDAATHRGFIMRHNAILRWNMRTPLPPDRDEDGGDADGEA